MKKLEVGQMVLVKPEFEQHLARRGLNKYQEVYGRGKPVIGRVVSLGGVTPDMVVIEVIKGMGFNNSSVGGDGRQIMDINWLEPVGGPDEEYKELVTVHAVFHVSPEDALAMKTIKASAVVGCGREKRVVTSVETKIIK